MTDSIAGSLPPASGGSGPVSSTEPAREEYRPAPDGSRADPTPTEGLFRRVRLQTLFRILAAVIGLVATSVVQWRGGLVLQEAYRFTPLYGLFAFVFATSIPAALGLRLIRSPGALAWLATVQFLIDVGVITALVHLTGGIDSPFTFLYLLTIINASLVLFRQGALLTATACTLSFGLLLALTYFSILRPFQPDLLGGAVVSTREGVYRIGVNAFAFVLTALLASQLAEVVRKAGQELAEKSLDLRELQALTRNIVENITSGLLSVDQQGRITSFNRSAEEITGRRSADVFGKRLSDVFPGVAERIGRRTVDARRFEEEFARSDGVSLTLGFSYSPLRDDQDREIGTIVIFQDLTELREMENRLKREERMAAVGRLAAGIAHEIRNPLASISGSIEILRGGSATSPEDSPLMEIILRETDRLDGLITEFLNYVKPLKQRMDRVDIEAVLHETADALKATDAGRSVEFKLPPGGAISPVRGDRDQLKQVVWNLFLNASQAMKGAGAVTVSAQPSVLGRQGDVALIEISDEGPGIPVETASRVFEPFYTTKERGTGLGLAMVHKLVEAHGGQIEVDSEPGKGATFRLVLRRWSEEDD